jgi:hypothetical protein
LDTSSVRLFFFRFAIIDNFRKDEIYKDEMKSKYSPKFDDAY